MAYQTYTTEALVCGSWQRNGADRTFLLYTRELGMLYATARSVREERSRQRYALQECAQIRVSLVKGRSGWRIGSVIDISHPFLAASTRAERIAVVKLLRTLRRFISGESATPEIYDLSVDALEHLAAGTISDPQAFALCVEYRILYQLGYIAPSDEERIVLQLPLDHMMDSVSADIFAAMESSISTATAVSHL